MDGNNQQIFLLAISLQYFLYTIFK